MVINGTKNCNAKKEYTHQCQKYFLESYLLLAILKPFIFCKIYVFLLCFHILIVACSGEFEKKKILRIFLKFREKTV